MAGKTRSIRDAENRFPHRAEEAGKQLVDDFLAHQSMVLALCDELEGIADSLPDRVKPQDCLAVAKRIGCVLRQAHEFEENHLWPVLRTFLPDDDGLKASLERLRYEHWEDESYAEELASVLADRARRAGDCNAETTGYMLRGFFEGVRRHAAFEREHMLPLLRKSVEARK